MGFYTKNFRAKNTRNIENDIDAILTHIQLNIIKEVKAISNKYRIENEFGIVPKWRT